jgi:hypothetical protein
VSKVVEGGVLPLDRSLLMGVFLRGIRAFYWGMARAHTSIIVDQFFRERSAGDRKSKGRK